MARLAGEKNLERLLAGMRPSLSPEPYGYAVASGDAAGLTPFATVREDEGLTVIAPSDALAAAGLDPGAPFARITLTVHSDLAAVGLTAAVATALAQAGLPANVVAGHFHDHIFVPWQARVAALEALKALAALSAGARA
ncbi:MAG: ACT domain-containing protein [Paracoccaceae bacterium]